MSAVVEYWWLAIPLKIALWIWIAGKVKEHNVELERDNRIYQAEQQAMIADALRQKEIILQRERGE